jgi:hypothetical protein
VCHYGAILWYVVWRLYLLGHPNRVSNIPEYYKRRLDKETMQRGVTPLYLVRISEKLKNELMKGSRWTENAMTEKEARGGLTADDWEVLEQKREDWYISEYLLELASLTLQASELRGDTSNLPPEERGEIYQSEREIADKMDEIVKDIVAVRGDNQPIDLCEYARLLRHFELGPYYNLDKKDTPDAAWEDPAVLAQILRGWIEDAKSKAGEKKEAR